MRKIKLGIGKLNEEVGFRISGIPSLNEWSKRGPRAVIEDVFRKQMTLEGYFNLGIVRPGDYVKYTVKDRICTLEEKHTGDDSTQVFRTEKIVMKLDTYKGKLILVAEDATRSTIRLEGSIGYMKGPETMDYVCRTLYTNVKIAEKVVAMSEDIWNLLSPANKFTIHDYVLSTRRIEYKVDKIFYSLRRTIRDCDRQRQYIENVEMCRSRTIGASSCLLGIRPTAFIKPKLILIGGNGTKESPWILSSNSKKK